MYATDTDHGRKWSIFDFKVNTDSRNASIDYGTGNLQYLETYRIQDDGSLRLATRSTNIFSS
jgi:hypothetical protein